MIVELKALLVAAHNMDWQQVVLNGGPPCFHLDDDGHFCGRALRWPGHIGSINKIHDFVSLETLIREANKA